MVLMRLEILFDKADLFIVFDFINSGLTGLGLSGLSHPPFSRISRISGLLAFAGDKVAPCHIGD
jgi:hypothetical protein